MKSSSIAALIMASATACDNIWNWDECAAIWWRDLCEYECGNMMDDGFIFRWEWSEEENCLSKEDYNVMWDMC